MLIGDAANQADPMNGGGIHKAMESACFAAEAAVEALGRGDFSRRPRRYEDMWCRQLEPDWRTAELFLSIAKNPSLNDFCLFLLRQMGRLRMFDASFRDFAGGIFAGIVSQDAWLAPRALYHAFPKERAAWLELLRASGREVAAGSPPGPSTSPPDTWPTPPGPPSEWPGTRRQHGLGPRPGVEGGLAAQNRLAGGPRGRRAAMTVHDVIVVGAGAGGSAAASLLARQGVDVLLLDKSAPPRDTVRSDGLMPQAVYWLDRLGCVSEVLAEAEGCIKGCDLYLDGRHLLTGRFPDDTPYPDFALLVLRRRFNEIMQAHAVASGARFAGGTTVRGVANDGEVVRVFADPPQGSGAPRAHRHRRGRAKFRRLALDRQRPEGRGAGPVGAHDLRRGEVRRRYPRLLQPRLLPSYGWMFIDEHQTACVGVGCAVDPKFPPTDNLGSALRQFIDSDLKATLADARRIGPFSGGIAPHFRPEAMAADGVLLIGDAACQADPFNRGGIHTAIESAFYAADACRIALDAGDFFRAALARYEALWSAHSEPDWRTSEIFMSLAKNPGLKELVLFLLEQVGTLGEADPRFGGFASGVFSGVVSQSSWLSVRALSEAVPKDPAAWAALLRENSKSKKSVAAGSVAFWPEPSPARPAAAPGWRVARARRSTGRSRYSPRPPSSPTGASRRRARWRHRRIKTAGKVTSCLCSIPSGASSTTPPKV